MRIGYMKFNVYFFRKHWHTLQKKLSDTLRNSRKSFFEFLGRLPRGEDVWARLRKNTLREDGRNFLKSLYTRLVIQGEYTRRDLGVLFIVAFFVGYGLKIAASQTITIGFEDYTLPSKERLLNMNAVQKKVTENGGAFTENDVVSAGVCSE